MKKTSNIWGGVFEKERDALMIKINESISFDKELYHQDIFASIVHSRMLAKQHIISTDEQLKIENGLKQIEEEISSGKLQFSQKLEDIHMNIESRLTEIIGEIGKKLHTARSRNDQVATDLKIYTREAFDEISAILKELLSTIHILANANIGTILPGCTHLQIAQPITLAHHLLCYFEMFYRDHQKIALFREILNNSCPLGSCALAGTSHNIDRHYTSKELGFKNPSGNSMDGVSDRDFAVDFLYVSSLISVHLSRLAEEIIIWANPLFGFITLPDEFSTGSSIMPQKRNPDAAELVRGKTGRIFGNLQGLLTMLKGLTLTYSKDMQEDKEPLFDSYKNIKTCLLVTIGMLQSIKFNTNKMLEATQYGYCTATEIADMLVQKHNLAFRDAHHITGEIIKWAIKHSKKLEDITLEEYQQFYPQINNEIFKVVDVQNCVDSKNSYGATSSNQVKIQLERLEKILKTL